MNGIFGDTFDFDGDGKLDIVEQAAELAFIANIRSVYKELHADRETGC